MLVIAFLPRIKHLLIPCLQSPSAVVLESKNIKSLTVSIESPSICQEDHMPWSQFSECWVLSQIFHSFTFIKRIFSSSSISAIRVISSAYLRLLIFLPAILFQACASSSLAFPIMYSAYELNNQGDNIPPWCTRFLIWNHSVVPCSVLSVLDLRMDFSGGRDGGLIFPSVGVFSSVCCYPYSQRLWHS